jgi:hypothetical protein
MHGAPRPWLNTTLAPRRLSYGVPVHRSGNYTPRPSRPIFIKTHDRQQHLILGGVLFSKESRWTESGPAVISSGRSPVEWGCAEEDRYLSLNEYSDQTIVSLNASLAG